MFEVVVGFDEYGEAIEIGLLIEELEMKPTIQFEV